MLSPEQIIQKKKFVTDYINSVNAATGSSIDANANVSTKNVNTMSGEVWKEENAQLKRSFVIDYIAKRFGKDVAEEYNRQVSKHEIYVHDETHTFKPYCASVSIYPFLLNGLVPLGGESKAPKHLASYCGNFINLCFALSAQLAGALAISEMLLVFDYFARKDYGEDYAEGLKTDKPLVQKIANHLQSIIYAINQPASARDYQSIFFNTSVFCDNYMQSLFKDFTFPDGSRVNFDSLMELQKFFMDWFNAERTKSILTFPVTTVAMLADEKTGKIVDEKFEDYVAGQMANANAFFIYTSTSADSLASCCRLRNEMQENVFNTSVGLTGVMTGSMNVITLNMNRFIQDHKDNYLEALKTQIEKIHMYQMGTYDYLRSFHDAHLLPIYDANFLVMSKQFLTIGISGIVEAAEFLGYEISYNPKYVKFLQDFLKVIYDTNKEGRQKYGMMFNTEFVPGENLGVRQAAWDKADGYFSPRECYNSYFFKPEDDAISVIDKMRLHGKEVVQYLDGGSACHLALDEYPTKEACKKLIRLAVKVGCNYFCTNVKITCCEDCGNIDKHTLAKCPKCGSNNICYATRVIGYLKKIKSFSSARQKEAGIRFYHKKKEVVKEFVDA